jgi:glycosyl transferase family 1
MLTRDASVLIIYKNFAANQNVSHIGLGVAAMNNQKVLRSLGLKVDVLPCVTVADLARSLAATPRTHVIVSAPWIKTNDLAALVYQYSDTYFAENCHSNVGFLQADPNGVDLFREAINLEVGTHNFHVAGNAHRFVDWVQACFGVDCAYLPNCYYLDSHTPPEHCWQQQPGVTLRIGVFGATRPLKNMMSATGAALQTARELRRPLELWISAGRTETGGATVMGAITALVKGLPGVSLHFNGWSSWPDFRRLLAQMHLLLQPSYTESFNMVTADGISQGVPSVVSDAIDWVPKHWIAPGDDVTDIAEAAMRVLHDRHAARDGYTALVRHNINGTRSWGRELGLSDLPDYTTVLNPPGFHRWETAS